MFFISSVISCAPVRHFDEAMRLKEYADEGDARDRMVSRRQAQMAALVARISRGDALQDLATQNDLRSQLGEPVLKETVSGSMQERWLYRDPVKYFDVPKVYFFIDARGCVVRWISEGIKDGPDSKTE